MKAVALITILVLSSLSVLTVAGPAQAAQPQRTYLCGYASASEWRADFRINVYPGGQATLLFSSGARMIGKLDQVRGSPAYTFLNLLTRHADNSAQINGPVSSAKEWNKVTTAIEVALDGVDYIDRRESFAFTVPEGSPENSSVLIRTLERYRNPLDFAAAFAGRWREVSLKEERLACR